MKVIYFSINDEIKVDDETAVCLGYFDGLHLGHYQLIKKALTSSYHSALLTFEFNDSMNFKNKHHITSLKDKENLLRVMGLEYLFVLKFDNDVMNLSPEDFIEKVVMKFNPKEIIVGEDYTFGKKAMGNFDTLNSLSKSRFDVIRVNELKRNGLKIGTRDIIKLIENGNIKEANALLNRFYSIHGTIENGFKEGHKHSFPTANIEIGDYVKPLNGVYATLVKIENDIFLSMTNVGIHPTINKLSSAVIETNIFDFDKDIYGKDIDIYFVEFIRPEKKFADIDALYNQLHKDKETCKEILEKFISPKMSIIPFYGLYDYNFNQDLSYFKKNFMNKEEVNLTGPTFESDSHLFEVKINDLNFAFDKNNQKLVEIDIFKSNLSLNNGIKIDMSLDDAIKYDPSLFKTDIDDVYVSYNGYLLVINNNYVKCISIFEKEYFSNLCLFEQERINRDNESIKLILEYIKKYFNNPNDDKIEKKLLDILSYNLDVTFHAITALKRNDYIKLNEILNKLVVKCNEYKDYLSDEYETLHQMIKYINDIVLEKNNN